MSRKRQKQLENLYYFFRCMLRVALAGKANKIPKDIRRVLVMPVGHLGDVVCNTQVFKALRNAYPSAHIMSQDVNGINSVLLADSGLVDEFFSFNESWGEGGPARRRARPDVVLITSPYYIGLGAAYLAGVKCIVTPYVTNGFSPVETRTYKALSRFAIRVPCSFGEYAPLARLRVLEPLGITTTDTTKHLGYSAYDREEADRVLASVGIGKGAPFVFMAAGSGNKIKEWPAERFAKVADYIWENYQLPIVIAGTKHDKEETENVLNSVDAKTGIKNLLDATTLGPTKALIARASLFISVDSGPLYIAEAFGVPTIDIVGPIDPREQPPHGPHNIVIVPPGSPEAEVHILNSRVYDYDRARSQSLSITVEQVTDAVGQLLKDLHVEKDLDALKDVYA